MYQSIPSLTIPPPRRPLAIRSSHRSGGRVPPNFFVRGSRFWIRETSNNFGREMQELLDLSQKKTGAAWKAGVIVLFYIDFCKYSRCIFYNLDHFRQFQSFFIKLWGHSRVISANARSSLKCSVSYIARFIVNIQSVSMLFEKVGLIFWQILFI